ncbi:MAG: hypothetical protein IKZ37_06100 [Bacteroidaceae bacterium]|nr:hypothetical protein [Bacteroidaceae bacterium]
MKRFFLLIFTLCIAFVANAQDVPYSKYLTYTKEEFKENKFKYDDDTNTWSLRKSSGLNVTLNVLAILADASEEVRPATNDYSILVQFGKEEKAAYVQVVFYNDDTYHKLLTFMKDNGQNLVETSSGKIVKHQAFIGDYALELDMEQRIISRTSSRTADRKAVKNVDESYNKYCFVIRTDVEPWSKYLDKQAAKKAKRDAKGKKKKTVDEMM